MSQYRVEHQIKPRPPDRIAWEDNDRPAEYGVMACRHGLVLLGRRPEGEGTGWDDAWIGFVWEGQEHRWCISPCPSREGLLGMARYRIRKIVGENHET